MKSKFISALAIAGTLALFGCSDSTPENSITSLGNDVPGEEVTDEGNTEVGPESSTTPEISSATEGLSSAAESSADLGTSSSSAENVTESSAAQSSASEPEPSFGWAKGNAPVGTRGCGKNTQLDLKYRGDKPYIDFQWSQGTRTVRIDIPKNYNKDVPSRLIFGMQCMGCWAGGVQDDGYYGLKPLDTE